MTSVPLRLLSAPPTLATPIAEPDGDGRMSADVVIVGSGMGGSTMAYALRDQGLDVLVVERGDFLPREVENWSPKDVFGAARYKNAGSWRSSDGTTFNPGVYYYVGGNTKFFGAMAPRFRAEDFEGIEHAEGISPAWPISYDDLEPYYGEAERLYGVHGTLGIDPGEPHHADDFPFPAVQHEPAIQDLADRLTKQGLTPLTMPLAIDRRPGGRCVQCRTCDGYPCMVDAKGDADVVALRPLVQQGRVRLITNTIVDRLETSPDGRVVTAAVGRRGRRPVTISGSKFVIAAGAANSAALFLRSAGPAHPHGLANTSDQVGRNYMVHNSTFFVAVDPRRRNETSFQKTLGWNDWYLGSDASPHPMGNVQMLGKLQAPMLKAARRRVPMPILQYMTSHSVDLYLTSEDLPAATNRVSLGRSDETTISWTPNNLAAHRNLVRHTTKVMRAAGYPLIFTERMGIETNSHMCGTLRMGTDPQTSVVDPTGKAHDLDNLWTADSSSFVSSAALNPALTIAANALRVAAVSSLAASHA